MSARCAGTELSKGRGGGGHKRNGEMRGAQKSMRHWGCGMYYGGGGGHGGNRGMKQTLQRGEGARHGTAQRALRAGGGWGGRTPQRLRGGGGVGELGRGEASGRCQRGGRALTLKATGRVLLQRQCEGSTEHRKLGLSVRTNSAGWSAMISTMVRLSCGRSRGTAASCCCCCCCCCCCWATTTGLTSLILPGCRLLEGGLNLRLVLGSTGIRITTATS